jgi:dienelactone hydrolase
MDAVLRTDVTLQGEVAAWLYRPDGATGCVVMGHGLSAVRDQRLPAYAERFAQAGLAALLFDYRHFGASAGEPRQLIDIERQLEDWRTAFAYARGLDGIERVGLFGSSFGGGHALEIASEEPAVAAVVAQCPMTDGLRAALMTPPPSCMAANATCPQAAPRRG